MSAQHPLESADFAESQRNQFYLGWFKSKMENLGMTRAPSSPWRPQLFHVQQIFCCLLILPTTTDKRGLRAVQRMSLDISTEKGLQRNTMTRRWQPTPRNTHRLRCFTGIYVLTFTSMGPVESIALRISSISPLEKFPELSTILQPL